MATLALRHAFPHHPKLSGDKRTPARHTRSPSNRRVWQTVFVTVAALGLSAFAIVAPILDDPRGHLAALDVVPTVPVALMRSDQAFEFTPTTQGPAISSEALAVIDIDEWLEMPELQIHAMPPAEMIEVENDG